MACAIPTTISPSLDIVLTKFGKVLALERWGDVDPDEIFNERTCTNQFRFLTLTITVKYCTHWYRVSVCFVKVHITTYKYIATVNSYILEWNYNYILNFHGNHICKNWVSSFFIELLYKLHKRNWIRMTLHVLFALVYLTSITTGEYLLCFMCSCQLSYWRCIK